MKNEELQMKAGFRKVFKEVTLYPLDVDVCCKLFELGDANVKKFVINHADNFAFMRGRGSLSKSEIPCLLQYNEPELLFQLVVEGGETKITDKTQIVEFLANVIEEGKVIPFAVFKSSIDIPEKGEASSESYYGINIRKEGKLISKLKESDDRIYLNNTNSYFIKTMDDGKVFVVPVNPSENCYKKQ